jgi:tRNA wybutosine-synthesizing protein 3
MNKFQEDKERQLNREDRSDKGEIDTDIRGVCRKINRKEDYYTTSSCAGRIILIKGLRRKDKGAFLFRTHNKVSFKELKKRLNGIDYKGAVYFKLNPCILHVACKNLDKAGELLRKARKAGWKRSGIMTIKKRIILELLSTEKMELPVMDNKEVLVSDDYLKLLVRESNDKLGRVRGKIKKFEELI